jgi:hypothetical protein
MGAAGEFGSFRHLAERFFAALSPAGPPPDDEAWARAQLVPGEQDLWGRMSGPDRRHAVGVARAALALLDDGGEPPGRPVVAGALLHDVGKVESGLGTFARVGVTLAAIAVGRARLAAAPAGSRVRWRVALYLTHDRVGGELLRRAGSDPLTVAWAEEHHLDPSRWSVDRRTGDALKAADGD